MKQPKLIIFDMDGLIFDTERLFMNFLTEIAQTYNYTVTEELYCKTLGTNGIHLRNIMLYSLGEDYPFDEISKKTDQKMQLYTSAHTLPMKAGLLPLLKFLKEKQIPCCVASSTKTSTVLSYLKSAQINQFFCYCIGGDQVHYSKPNPEIFLKACDYFSINPKDALVLEDSENGILASSTAEIPVICVPDLKFPQQDILSKTVCLIDRLDKLIPILS